MSSSRYARSVGPSSAPSTARTDGQHGYADASAWPLGGSAPGPRPQVRRLRQDRLIAGVATGLAEHLRVPLLGVRIAFVGLAAIAGFGLVLYAAMWVCVPLRRVDPPSAPGLAAAERSGFRPSARRFRVGDAGQLAAFTALAIGLLLFVQASSLGVDATLFWPAVVVGGGVLLLWRQGDEAIDAAGDGAAGLDGSTAETAATPGGVRATLRAGGWRGLIRILAGGTLVLVGLATFVVASGRLDVAGDVLIGGVIAAIGILLVAGPWLLQIYRSLRVEREDRILSQERADVAAHLHDSVLQTLALIQRQAQDPREVIRLARSQERDLRGWLYGQQQAPDASLRAALERVAAEVEEEYGVPVEVVVVGDCPMDDHLRAMTQAAREALVNAAKHADASRTDLYAEVEEHEVLAYVRDRGIGFDPDAVDGGRLGLRHSIVERMSRHGGRASVRSAPGEGTEVRLEMARSSR